MKNKMLRNQRKMLAALAGLFFVFMAGGVSQLSADDWGGHQRYQNQDGFFDGGHHYHPYDHYRGHRGY